MATYRLSRNTERSIIDFLTEELNNEWNDPINLEHHIYVEKAFSQIHDGKFPAILVNVTNRPDKRREISSSSLMKFINLELRIFAEDDGQRLDLADWLLEKIIPGIEYYEYMITQGQIFEKVLKGRIVILEIVSNRKELVNLEGLAKEDRFRHLLSLRCRISKTS